MSAYLDPSVLVPRIVEEPASAAIQRWLLDCEQELLISDFAAAEVASGLARLVRLRLMDIDDAASRLDDFEVWRAATSTPVDLHPADPRLAYAYVRRFELRLRAPDALHLAIARRLDAVLVTLDQRQAAAARAMGVAVETPIG